MIILLFIFGLLIGSFLNVVILRLPAEEDLGGRSHCPRCRHQLSAAELVPVFSYLFLRGRCKNCGQPISFRYPLIELVTGLLFALAWVSVHPATLAGYIELVKVACVCAVCLVVFMVDLEHFLILDQVIFPAIVLVALLNLGWDLAAGHAVFNLSSAFSSGLLAAAGAGLAFFAVWYFSGGTWMGFGDVKLALLLGIILGWPLIAVNLLLAFFLGAAVSVILLIRGSHLKTQVPFGTFLSFACVVTIFWGPQLLHWYLGLLGV